MTETTVILARILGGYMLVMGVGMLIHRRMALDLKSRGQVLPFARPSRPPLLSAGQNARPDPYGDPYGVWRGA